MHNLISLDFLCEIESIFKMLINNYYNKEIENETSETQYICDICMEAITNPLCPFCLTIEIKAWLTFYPSLKEELMPKINKYLKEINNKITNYGTQCIKCKNKRAFVCHYCFTEYIFNELNSLNAQKIILKEFTEFFNFDFEHFGYSKKFIFS